MRRSEPVGLQPVPQEQAAVIRQMLESTNSVTIKTGLQRACELLETNRAFLDPTFLIIAIEAHVHSKDIKVRRWCYKVAGRLRATSIIPSLRDAFEREEGVDAENRSWAGAAYLGLVTRRERAEIIKRLDDSYYGTELELAAQLFNRGEPEPIVSDLRTFEDNALARKWLSINCGYSQQEPRTLDRRFSDLELVRDAVLDDDPEIIEYAIWAEHQHPKGSFKFLRLPLDELQRHENVRRWLYRLLTKSEASARTNVEMLADAMHPLSERSEVAREGLALGIANLRLKHGGDPVEWFTAEESLRVKMALVDHLGRRTERVGTAREVLIAEYAKLDPHDLLAMKIEATLPLGTLDEVKRRRGTVIGARPPPMLLPASNGQYGLDLDYSRSQPIQVIQNGGTLIMTEKNFSVSGSGNSISGVNLGEMIASTISAASQSADQDFKALAPNLGKFLRTLENDAAVPEDEKRSVTTLAKEAAEAAEAKDKGGFKGKLSLMKTVVKGLIAAPKATEQLIKDGGHLIDTIGNMVG